MAHWWMAQAGYLQEANRRTEGEKQDFYTEEEAKRAAVYTREDMSYLIGLTGALNQQAQMIRNCLIAIFVVLVIIAVRVCI